MNLNELVPVLTVTYEPMNHVFQVETHDRGDWTPVKNPIESSVFELQGYGGESSLVIIVSVMQDTSAYIVVVHNIIDSPVQVAQRHVKADKLEPKDRTFQQVAHTSNLRWIDLGMNITKAINEMILEVNASQKVTTKE